MTTPDWFQLLFAGAYLVLLNWQRLTLMSFKKSIDEETAAIRDSIEEEKKQTVWRVDEIYKRVDRHKSEHTKAIKDNSDMTHKSRQEVEDKMVIITENHMTEIHVKEYVNGKVVPLEKLMERSLKATEVLASDMSELKSDVRVTNTLLTKLAERSN